jgi:hypothetical protein
MVLTVRADRFRRDDRGLVLVIFGLVLTVLLILAALVVDVGYARQQARHAAASSDAAALAGAQYLPLAGPDAAAAIEVKAQAASYAASNIIGSPQSPTAAGCGAGVPANSTCYTVDDASITVATPYALAGGPPSFGLVYVKICRPTDSYFGGVVDFDGANVCREAVARRVNVTGGFGFGLVALHPTDCKAMEFAGNSETVLSSNGAVMVNSACSNTNNGALNASGSSWDLIASFIGVVGTATLAPCAPPANTNCTTTVPTTGISHFDDPLGHIPEPSSNPADYPARTCPSTTGPQGDHVMLPGYYPSTCSFTRSGDNVIFRPGFYYFADGFDFRGGTITCRNEDGSLCTDGVTLYNAGGSITLNGNGQTHLPPPSSGPYEGITIFQARSNTNEVKINGTADFTMGTIYAPAAHLKFNGTGGGDQVNVTGLVVGSTIDISGTFDFNINVPLDGPVTPPADDIGLER